MSVYMSAATVHHAEKIVADHTRDEDGWCRFCLLNGRIRVRVGECKPYQLAQRGIDARAQQRERIAHRPPVPQVTFARPGGRVWPTET